MAQTSVAQFASELKVPPSVLLEQLRAAGVDKKQADDALSEQDKSRLLEYLRKMHGSAEQKNKITLTRKHTQEIKKTDASGKYRTVQVEVRKKRVFVKRDPAEVTAQAVAAETPPPTPRSTRSRRRPRPPRCCATIPCAGARSRRAATPAAAWAAGTRAAAAATGHPPAASRRHSPSPPSRW